MPTNPQTTTAAAQSETEKRIADAGKDHIENIRRELGVGLMYPGDGYYVGAEADVIWLLDQLAALRAKCDALQQKVDALPKTADGVPIVPGMTVHVRGGEFVDERRVVAPYGRGALLTREPARHGACEGDAHRLAETCFSTRDAALAAQSPPSQPTRGDEQKTCGELVTELAAKAPNCPKHPDTKMTYADGMEHHHDLKYPHWRCELWIGSGVCGATRPLGGQPTRGESGEVQR